MAYGRAKAMPDKPSDAQENLDALMGKVLSTPKPKKADPPKATKADYERKFRLVFDEGKPVMEEVEEE